MILLGETIPQDSMLEFAPNSNIIGATGQTMLQRYMQNEGLPVFPDDWTWVYNDTSTEKRYKGKFAKRAGKFVHDETGNKLSEQQRATLGKLARDNAANGNIYRYDVTDGLDWTAGDYGDYGSCFWDSNSSARTAMQENDKFYALRFYDIDNIGDGRAWLYHMDRDAIILFNAYGSIELLEMASMLCQLRGSAYTYNRIRISNHGQEYGTLYLNSGCGYVICKKDHHMANKDAFDFELACADEDRCSECGIAYDEYNSYYVEGYGELCESCYCENFFSCESCEETYNDSDAMHVKTKHGFASLCSECFADDAFECIECGANFMNEDCAWSDGDTSYCSDCYDENVAECSICETEYHKHETSTGNSELCQECFDAGYILCNDCHKSIPQAGMFPGVGIHKGKVTCAVCTAQAYGYTQISMMRYALTHFKDGSWTHYALTLTKVKGLTC